MKKVFFTALAFVWVSQAVNAQTGSILVGGNINITSSKASYSNGDSKVNSFSLNPTVGYQLNDNWTAGLVAAISFGKSENAGTTLKSSAFNIGPFIRYAKSISNIFAVYGQLQSSFGTAKLGDATSNLANVTAFPAIFINVKNGFGLNFSVGGLSYNSSKPSGGVAVNTFNLTFGQSVGIGISKNFGTRKTK